MALIHIPEDPDYPEYQERYVNPGAVFAICKDGVEGKEYWKVYSISPNLVTELSPRQMQLLAEKNSAEKNTIIPAPVKPPIPSPGAPGADPAVPTDISSFNVLD